VGHFIIISMSIMTYGGLVIFMVS